MAGAPKGRHLEGVAPSGLRPFPYPHPNAQGWRPGLFSRRPFGAKPPGSARLCYHVPCLARDPAVPARIALLLLLPLTARAEPGPAPHESRPARHGHPLPPGAVARLGVPPALTGFPWALGWTADGRRFVTVDYGGGAGFDAATRPRRGA